MGSVVHHGIYYLVNLLTYLLLVNKRYTLVCELSISLCRNYFLYLFNNNHNGLKCTVFHVVIQNLEL